MLWRVHRKRTIDMMNDNSSMIAVLCSHLCSENCKPFEPSEWTRFADLLIEHKLQPKDIPDLSDNDMKQCFGYSEADVERIKKLLDRSGSLSFELGKYSARGIKVVTRADKGYPRALKQKLQGNCPPMFYYAGELALLDRKTVGFVGARTVSEEDISFAENTVRKINKLGFGVVSGGARGGDSTASAASRENGSFCIEYVSDSLARKLKNSEVISSLQSGQLLILSLAKPDAGFNAGIAMQRNKYIYVQSEATVVVKSDYNKGGTWGGASEALKKDYCPVLCRDHQQYLGNSGLIRLGAVPIGDSWDGNVEKISSMKPDDGEQLTFLDQD